MPYGRPLPNVFRKNKRSSRLDRAETKRGWTQISQIDADGTRKPGTLEPPRLLIRTPFSGLPQAYVMDLATGGEAMRVTSLSAGVSSPRWSPDGKMLLFVSSVFPGTADDETNKKIAAERKAQKYKARVYEGFPIRRWDKWLDDTQVHLFVQSLEPATKAKDLLAGTKLVAEPGFAGKSADSGEDLEAIWAPDGKSIVFTATTIRNTAA